MGPYKKGLMTKLVVYVVALAVIVLIWIRNSGLFPWVSILSTLLSLGVAFFTSNLLRNIVVNNEITKRLGYLHMEKDPEKFIKSFFFVPGEAKKEREKMIYHAYLADGYEANGDFSAAIETIEKGNIGGSESLDCLKYSSLSRYYLENECFDEAKKYLDLLTKKVDSILDNTKLKENQREAEYILSERLEVAEGGVGDIEYLEGRLKCAQYAIRRLEVLWAIALHYKNTGNEKKRRETLKKLKEEAGKTWYGAWAEKEMERG